MKKRMQLIAALLTAAVVMAVPAPAFAGEAVGEEVSTEAAEDVSNGEASTEAVEAAPDSEASTEVAKDVSDKVASADEMVTPEDVVEEGMVPVEGSAVADGTYTVEVLSSSSMFKIVDCQLTAADGKMSAVMTMSGQGYGKLYMGTGEEAAAASEEDCIPAVENEAGEVTFEVPVEALDQGIDCAAWSKKKEKWYDRVLVFKAASLPAGAVELAMTTAEELGLADGTYTVEAALAGGSGRTSVESPAVLNVKDGEMTAVIIFSSSNYDYVRVGEETYYAANTEGNSTFEIPVDGLDYAMPIVGDTVAMSEPHEIDYTLTFDSATLKAAE